MKNNAKGIMFALISLLVSSFSHATMQHPTCKIELASLTAALHNDTPIKYLEKKKAIYGLVARKKEIAVLKKYQDYNVDLMIEKVLTEKGYEVSWQEPKENNMGQSFSFPNYRPKSINHDDQIKDVAVTGEYYVEKMSGDFSVLTWTKRLSAFSGFTTRITLTADLKITDPMLSQNRTYTFYKQTVEVDVKDGDVQVALEDVVARGLVDVPVCTTR